MFHVLYASVATEPFTTEQLRELLRRAREHNVAAGITGMLLYKNGNFMQVLQGEEPAVRALTASIQQDQRHCAYQELLQGQTQRRSFADWSMGFADLGGEEARNTPGYSEFLNTPLNAKEFARDPSRAMKLLMLFKEMSVRFSLFAP